MKPQVVRVKGRRYIGAVLGGHMKSFVSQALRLPLLSGHWVVMQTSCQRVSYCLNTEPLVNSSRKLRL